MMKRVMAVGILGLSLGLIGCEEKKSGFKVGQKSTAEGCQLSFDTLAGTEWIMLRINPDKTETPDYSARAKFFKEGDTLKVKYNVASVSDMYTYTCLPKDDELQCREEPKVKDWCQALAAADKECSLDAIHAIDDRVTQKQYDEGKAKADKVIAQFKKDPENWKKYKFQNNNLGNKLQGLLYIKVDKRTCNLRFTDNYMTIYDGKRIEDSNPVGTNPFVKNDQGELLWEHCENREDLIARKEAEYPKDPDKVGHWARYGVGDPIHVWYLAKDGRLAQEGCSQSFDVWLNGKPYAKDQTPEIVEGRRHKKELRWHQLVKLDRPSPSAQGDAITFVRHTKCEGKPEVTAVSCAAVMIQ